LIGIQILDVSEKMKPWMKIDISAKYAGRYVGTIFGWIESRRLKSVNWDASIASRPNPSKWWGEERILRPAASE
jgi:hypothetical protein